MTELSLQYLYSLPQPIHLCLVVMPELLLDLLDVLLVTIPLHFQLNGGQVTSMLRS